MISLLSYYQARNIVSSFLLLLFCSKIRGLGGESRHADPSEKHQTSGTESFFEEHSNDFGENKGFQASETAGRRRRHKGHTVSRGTESSRSILDAERQIFCENENTCEDQNVKSVRQTKLDTEWVQREWLKMNKIEKQKAAMKRRANRRKQLDLLSDETLNKNAQEREQSEIFTSETMKRKETIPDINSSLEVSKPLSIMDNEKEESYGMLLLSTII